MLYIITALKPEAQAFVDRYKLKKNNLDSFTIFSNDNMKLIISGLGVYNATMATQTFINNYDIDDEDIYINVGICGANENYEIGTLLEISSINYNNQKYFLNNYEKKNITCLDKESDEDIYEIVDMESYGFYDATNLSTAIKNIHMFKVVSDHFEPKKVTKEITKSLIFKKLQEIMKRIEA